ncbi:CaiF/GrlA family transcriptional regulator, partial [Salmonella enterica]
SHRPPGPHRIPDILQDAPYRDLPLYMLVAWWVYRQTVPVSVRDVSEAFHISARRAHVPCRVRLTAREVTILRHTLEGRSLEWMAGELGVAAKTVWAHRRRAMDILGVRRLHDLMQLPPEVLCGRPS